MPISGSINRPKTDVTVTVPINIDVKTATLSGNKINLPVVLSGVVIGTYTVASCTTTNANATVSAAAGAFSGVRAGDAVSGTGIAANTKVQSVATNGSSIVLTANATASGTVTLTFDPGTVDSTLYILSIDHSVVGTQIKVTPNLYQFDGTQVANGGSGYDAATIATNGSTVINLTSLNINVDDYLTKARKPRTNT